MTNEPVENLDPYSPENIGVVHFIQLGRIYDVLMAILRESNEEVAEALLEAHLQGDLLMPPPIFNGEFKTSE